ncbi:MAG: RHS repeat protein [Lachnospiraceae bacterium]|nr:RHS repeat protein [Lachnospiraceae bacterium]
MKKLIYFCLCANLFLTYPMYSIEAATYEYDELGRVTQATNEDGSLVTYVYDANGNLVEIKTEVGEAQTEMPGSDEGRGEETTNGMQNSIGTVNSAIRENATEENKTAEHVTDEDGVSANTAENDTTGTDTIDEDIIADIEAKLEGQSEDKNDGFGILKGIAIGAVVVVVGGAFFWLFIKKKKKDNAKEEEES